MRLILFALLSILAFQAQGAGPATPAQAAQARSTPPTGLPPRTVTTGDVPELPELATQAHVYTASLTARNDPRWVDGCLDLDLDIERFGCRIVAYRIRWFSGKWSGWFVPGVNDLYKKPDEPLRRFWACFNDHGFEIIYRTPGQPLAFELGAPAAPQ